MPKSWYKRSGFKEKSNWSHHEGDAQCWLYRCSSAFSLASLNPSRNRSTPSPCMIAFINAKKRSEYSSGGTGLILCYKTSTNVNETL